MSCHWYMTWHPDQSQYRLWDTGSTYVYVVQHTGSNTYPFLCLGFEITSTKRNTLEQWLVITNKSHTQAWDFILIFLSKVQTNLFFCFMLRPEYENNLRILIITVPESEIEIEYKTLSWAWVWDLSVIITQCYWCFKVLSRPEYALKHISSMHLRLTELMWSVQLMLCTPDKLTSW